MAQVKEKDHCGHDGRQWFEIISTPPGNENWVLSLPANLKAYQTELENLLGNVFAGRPLLPENLALAQQMSLNWCVAKCREIGETYDEQGL